MRGFEGERLGPQFEITDAILSDFENFLRDRKLEFTKEDIQNNLEYVKRRIKQEILRFILGD